MLSGFVDHTKKINLRKIAIKLCILLEKNCFFLFFFNFTSPIHSLTQFRLSGQGLSSAILLSDLRIIRARFRLRQSNHGTQCDVKAQPGQKRRKPDVICRGLNIPRDGVHSVLRVSIQL